MILPFIIACAIGLGCTTTQVDTQINQKLDNTIIPDINFSGTVVDDVIAFLEEASVASDPGRIGVSIELSRQFRGARFPGDPDQIAMSGRRLTLRQALDICCRLLNAEYRIRSGCVLIQPRNHN